MTLRRSPPMGARADARALPAWPRPARPSPVRTRRDPPPSRAPNTIVSLVRSVGVPDGVPVAHSAGLAYFDLLDRVLEDREITTDEVAASCDGTPAAAPNADGTVDLCFGPIALEGKGERLCPDCAWQGLVSILRTYGPMPPFFDKSWQAGEIEPISRTSLGLLVDAEGVRAIWRVKEGGPSLTAHRDCEKTGGGDSGRRRAGATARSRTSSPPCPSPPFRC